MLSKKGSLNHKRFGRAYKNVMYAVAGSGALMASIVMAMPLTIKYEFANADNAQEIATNLRYFWAFLFYLAILSYTTTRHGNEVLVAKDHRQLLRRPGYVLPIILLALGGLGLMLIGVQRDSTLHIIFGILGLVVSLGMLRYIYKQNISPRAYYLEHIGSMMGSGIGAYTAFLVFGGRHLLSVTGSYQILLWIAPGILGSILSYYLTKKYAKAYKITKKTPNQANYLAH